MHVALIPDGNRRWAKQRNISLEDAYLEGVNKFGDFLKWSKELNVKEVTVWAMSYDNFKKRSQKEIDLLFNLIRKHDEWLTKDAKNTKISFYGRLSELPEDIFNIIKKIEHKYSNGQYKINILFLYNGRIELIEACKQNPRTDQELWNSLWIKSSPDIIIRTGGRTRTSGFLPVQSEYSEWFFLDILWPDFNKQHYLHILEKFQKIERNFGK